MAIFDRITSAWNAFRSTKEDQVPQAWNRGPTSYVRPYAPQLRYSNERTIVSSVYTRLSMDVSGPDIKQILLDEKGRYIEDVDSFLNKCFMLEANLDQGPRAFRQNIATVLFDKGVAAIVPVDTSRDPQSGGIVDIYTVRVGEIKEWFPKHVRVCLYNEATGLKEEIVLEKRAVAIVENPLYGVMNEPNSTLQRLISKLNMLDAVDAQSSSGKLDLIIQLPYVIKSETRRQQAEARRQDIELQLKGSQYGIAYTDGTEKITQLNRPAENNLLAQIQFLTDMLYSQLGITKEVMEGTADEKVMINYYNRTVTPILDAIIEAMQRTFLGTSGTLANQRIRSFRNPFGFVPVSELANIADKFTRNEILSANEVRDLMGLKPHPDPKADELNNSNMPTPPDTQTEG